MHYYPSMLFPNTHGFGTTMVCNRSGPAAIETAHPIGGYFWWFWRFGQASDVAMKFKNSDPFLISSQPPQRLGQNSQTIWSTPKQGDPFLLLLVHFDWLPTVNYSKWNNVKIRKVLSVRVLWLPYGRTKTYGFSHEFTLRRNCCKDF